MDTTKNAILCHLSSVPYPVNLSPSKKSLQPSWVFFLAPGEKPKYIKVKHLDSIEMVTFCFLLVTRERLALLFNLLFSEFQIFFFFVKIECGLYLLDRFDVLISKMIFKK